MQDISAYFRALADHTRLTIVRYLARHEQVTVTQLGRELHLSQPLISWHLRRLRRAGIVQTRREGRQVWCSLDRVALQTYERRLDHILGLEKTEDADQGYLRPVALKPAKHG